MYYMYLTTTPQFCVLVNMRIEHGRGRGARLAGEAGSAERMLLTRPPRDLRGGAPRRQEASGGEKGKKAALRNIYFLSLSQSYCREHMGVGDSGPESPTL